MEGGGFLRGIQKPSLYTNNSLLGNNNKVKRFKILRTKCLLLNAINKTCTYFSAKNNFPKSRTMEMKWHTGTSPWISEEKDPINSNIKIPVTSIFNILAMVATMIQEIFQEKSFKNWTVILKLGPLKMHDLHSHNAHILFTNTIVALNWILHYTCIYIFFFSICTIWKSFPLIEMSPIVR